MCIQDVPKMTQISTKFDNFWHTGSQDDKIMWESALIQRRSWHLDVHARLIGHDVG